METFLKKFFDFLCGSCWNFHYWKKFFVYKVHAIVRAIPSFNAAAPPKLIVKFTRREVRDRFYSNRKNLARKQIKDIPGLGSGHSRAYISESLTPSRKKLFGEINKIKKSRKWKFICEWRQNGRIFLREAENTRIYGFNAKEDFAEFCRRWRQPVISNKLSITSQHSE